MVGMKALRFSAGLQRHPFQWRVHCLGRLCQDWQQEAAQVHRLHTMMVVR